MNNCQDKVEIKKWLSSFFQKLQTISYRLPTVIEVTGVNRVRIDKWVRLGHIKCRNQRRFKLFTYKDMIIIYMIDLLIQNDKRLPYSVNTAFAYYEYFFENGPEPEVKEKVFEELGKFKLNWQVICRLYNQLSLSKTVVVEAGLCSRNGIEKWVDLDIIEVFEISGSVPLKRMFMLNFTNIFKVFLIKNICKTKFIHKDMPRINRLVEEVESIFNISR